MSCPIESTVTPTIERFERRQPYEPAPIHCEGECDDRLTMHSYVRGKKYTGYSDEHDIYKCDVCGTERIWG